MTDPAKLVADLRRRLSVTQVGLADLVSVAPNTVARWERGEASPSAPALAALTALHAYARRNPPKAPWPDNEPDPAAFSVARLLDLLRDAVAEAGVPYAVGGAHAMAAHGYVRQTGDVDVFVAPEHASALMRALREAGLRTDTPGDSHHVAFLPGDPDPERRIDVLTPHGDPEAAGIAAAERDPRTGLLVMPPRWLAATKFVAWRDSTDPRHAVDVVSMIRRGLLTREEFERTVLAFDRLEIKRARAMLRKFSPRAS